METESSHRDRASEGRSETSSRAIAHDRPKKREEAHRNNGSGLVALVVRGFGQDCQQPQTPARPCRSPAPVEAPGLCLAFRDDAAFCSIVTQLVIDSWALWLLIITKRNWVQQPVRVRCKQT